MQVADLASILRPISPAEFRDRYLGEEYLYVPGNGDKFSELLPWPVLNKLLEHPGMPLNVAVFQGGQIVAPQRYVISAGPDSLSSGFSTLSVPELTGLLQQGATLILNGIDKFYGPLKFLTHRLTQELLCHVSVNMYAAWRTSHGFNNHCDSHDVLILQIHGRKQWKLFGKASEQLGHPPSSPCWDRCLTAGDLLYIPRGCWHLAIPCDEPTLHLTVGIYSPRVADLLKWLAAEIGAQEGIDKDVPLFDPEKQMAFFDALRSTIIESISRPDVLQRFLRDRWEQVVPRGWFGLPWTASKEGVPISDNVLMVLTIPSEALRIRKVSETEEVEFQIGSQHYRLHQDVAALLEFVRSAKALPLESFYDRWQGQFPREELTGLVSQLVTAGVVALMEADGPHG